MEARTGCAMVEFVFEPPDPSPDYWSFSEIGLARSSLLVAESRSGPGNGFLRAEAMRLFLLWREAINARDRTRDQREDRVALPSSFSFLSRPLRPFTQPDLKAPAEAAPELSIDSAA